MSKLPKVITGIQCASAGPSQPGGFSYQFQQQGFNYVLDQFGKMYDKGISDTVLLHRATGATFGANGLMSLFSSLDLVRVPFAQDILYSTRWFLSEFDKRFPDGKIIAYFGTTAAQPDREKRYWNVRRGLGPWLLHPKVTIAFDHAGQLSPLSAYGKHILRVSKTRNVIIQPQPRPWSVTYPFQSMMLQRWWRKHADKSRPCMRWLTGHEFKEAQSPWVKGNTLDTNAFIEHCLKRKDTPIVNIGQLKQLLETKQTGNKDGISNLR